MKQIKVRRHLNRNTPVGTNRYDRFGISPEGRNVKARLGPLVRILRVVQLLQRAGANGLDYDALCRAVVCSPKTIEIDAEGGAKFRRRRFVLKFNPFSERRVA